MTNACSTELRIMIYRTNINIAGTIAEIMYVVDIAIAKQDIAVSKI